MFANSRKRNEICNSIGQKKPPKISLKTREELTGYLFILLPVIGFLLFSVASIVVAVYYSFTNFNPVMNVCDWVGFRNYENLFKDSEFINALVNTVLLLASIPIGITLGLLLAIYLKKLAHGSVILSLIYYLPAVTSAVAINVVWRYIFNGEYGILNSILGTDLFWLGENDTTLVKIAICIRGVWSSIGTTMILYLAGLNNISKDYYEAADIVGASKWQQLVNITIPFSNPTTFYLLITSIIGGLQSYADAQVLANGVRGSRTIVYYIWTYGINDSRYGLACAASVFLALCIIVLSIVQFTRSKMFQLK